MAGGDHLPPEIWREVFARLPVKSILRCRSVCKSWYSLISCPNFISYFSTKNLNKNRNRVLLQLWDNRSNVISFSSCDESFMESREHDDLPETFHDRDVEFVGSCNGLVSLCKYTKDADGSYRMTFLIWNPTIRKIVELPSRIYAQFPSYLGFGFDSKTSDYKVLCALDNVCEIFDLRKGVWRSISRLMQPRTFGFMGQECYLDGAVHWSNGSDMILLSFNMSDECFRDIKMPNFTELQGVGNPITGNSIITRSMTLGGLIYVIAWNTVQSCSVWVMKEYGVAESWTKLSNIDQPSTKISPHRSLLWENGEFLMVERNQNLVLYNTERRSFERVLPITKWVREMCMYEESLVLLSAVWRSPAPRGSVLSAGLTASSPDLIRGGVRVLPNLVVLGAGLFRALHGLKELCQRK